VTKFDLVITFLALLEMSKLRMTRLFQTEPLAPIYIELATIAPGDASAPVIDASLPVNTATKEAEPAEAAASEGAPIEAAASEDAHIEAHRKVVVGEEGAYDTEETSAPSAEPSLPDEDTT